MSYEALARQLPWGRGVKLLTVDPNGLLAVAKDCGVLSHPNKASEQDRALLRTPYRDETQAYLASLGSGEQAVYLLNRLDSATSGVVLLALDEAVAAQARAAFEGKRVRKLYEALVFGLPRRGERAWRDRLSVRRAGNALRSEAGGGLTAETHLIAVRALPGVPLMSLITLMPVTGRTHQLRVQTAKRGCPIVGDRTYGDFGRNKQVAKSHGLDRLCLHCVETELSYELKGQRFRFQARCPSPFGGQRGSGRRR